MMFDTTTIREIWSLLDAREKKASFVTLGIMIIGAIASATMVASIMPFLAVLSDPDYVENSGILSGLYNWGGFESDYSFQLAIGVISFVVIILSSGLQILKTYAVARFSLMRSHSISKKLLTAYLSCDYEYFLDKHSGELTKKITFESHQLVMQYLRPFTEMIASCLTAFAIVMLLLWVNAGVALSAIVVLGGIYVVIYSLVRSVQNNLGKQRVAMNSQRFKIVSEVLGGIKTLKLLGHEQQYLQRYSAPSITMAKTQVSISVLSTVPYFALQGVALGSMILLGLFLVGDSSTDTRNALEAVLPTLGVFAFAIQRLMPELQKIYRCLSEMQAGSAAVETVHADFLATAGQSTEFSRDPDRIRLQHTMELRGISYNYPGSQRTSIHCLDLEIRAGERIGIIGQSGSGKTTLADVIIGLLKPKSGDVIIDGCVLDWTNIRKWRNSVGYVPQEIFLADDSIAANIALGFKGEAIDRDKVIEVAKLAKLHDFISEEPEGYETMVGERGVRLSGGQKQRIGIARALYTKADLIVFDEATSSLDVLTEQEVMSAVDGLPSSKTVVMIAHRLSTLKSCDRIIILEYGEVIANGSWSTLMRENDKFRTQVNDAAPAK